MKIKNLTDKIILKKLKEHKGILKKYEVRKIGLFGSFVRKEQNKNSDIDFIVEFRKPNFDSFMDLAFYLENLFGRKVEILTPAGLNSIRIKKVAENIKRTVVYG